MKNNSKLSYAGKIGNGGIGRVSAQNPATGANNGGKVKKGTDLRCK